MENKLEEGVFTFYLGEKEGLFNFLFILFLYFLSFSF